DHPCCVHPIGRNRHIRDGHGRGGKARPADEMQATHPHAFYPRKRARLCQFLHERATGTGRGRTPRTIVRRRLSETSTRRAPPALRAVEKGGLPAARVERHDGIERRKAGEPVLEIATRVTEPGGP